MVYCRKCEEFFPIDSERVVISPSGRILCKKHRIPCRLKPRRSRLKERYLHITRY